MGGNIYTQMFHFTLHLHGGNFRSDSSPSRLVFEEMVWGWGIKEMQNSLHDLVLNVSI